MDNLLTCLRVSEGHESYVRLLKCDHEAADDRIMCHINHAVIIDQFQKVIVASADTDVFIFLMHHFRHSSMHELEELWVIKGQGNSFRAALVHNLVRLKKSDVVNVLPAVHAQVAVTQQAKLVPRNQHFKPPRKQDMNSYTRLENFHCRITWLVLLRNF